jgi:hypothetical protein
VSRSVPLLNIKAAGARIDNIANTSKEEDVFAAALLNFCVENLIPVFMK